MFAANHVSLQINIKFRKTIEFYNRKEIELCKSPIGTVCEVNH